MTPENETLTSLRRVRDVESGELATLVLSMETLADDEVSYNIVSNTGETLAAYTADSLVHNVSENLAAMGYERVS